ncbi:MAG: hypothetical protein JNL70_21625 [Saprospiraceae bacterium]|nr:hypothetical protein [Saprospiraceae bacterium]
MNIEVKPQADFNRESLINLAGRFSYSKSDPEIKRVGFLTKEQFLEIAEWKSWRPKKWYQKNEAEFIEEVTKASFSATTERFRIESLTLLSGVDYPVASAILHFGCDPLKYPIIDFRTLWSLYSIENTQIKYGFDFWDKYRNDCLMLSTKYSLSIRELDKALWQYSSENQK